MILNFICRWVELLVTNSNLIDYVYTILRDERVSLNDPIILTFIELYFPKVSELQAYFISNKHLTHDIFFLIHLQVSLLHIDRLVDSICQTITSKENYDEICGDLLALRVMTQNETRIPASILRDMKRCLHSIFVRFKDKFAALEGREMNYK